MKIVITGASGFVGRSLVGLLSSKAALLLVGRDTAMLARQFPDHESCSYGELAQRGQGADLMLHLAAVNNNQRVSASEFQKGNVDLLINTVQSARKAGIRRVINVSSVHALDNRNRSLYATSKRAALDAIRDVDGVSVRTLFLAAVYTDEWRGRLAFLNLLPRGVARMVFGMLASLKPTLHISRLAAYVLKQPTDIDIDILSDGQGGNVFYRTVRRTCDVTVSLALLLLFWWALAIIWAVVRYDSTGPGIFAQERVGRNGKLFTCYKFRTMKIGTPQEATNRVPAVHVTRFGALLRRTKLDELPQVWNILRNEMTLIGPRPCLPGQHELIAARCSRSVLTLKPGISGLSQINDIDMSDPDRLARSDQRYLALQSLLLDLRIGYATIRGRGQGDRVIDLQTRS